MQEDDLRESSNVEDRRGVSGVGAGGLGIGAIVVLTLIGWATGINPALLIGGAEQVQQTVSPQSAQRSQAGTQGAPSDQMGRFVSRILGETEDVWSKQLPAETGKQYQAPVLVLFSGRRIRAAARRSPRWGRSIARSTESCISTRRSSTTCARNSAAAAILRTHT